VPKSPDRLSSEATSKPDSETVGSASNKKPDPRQIELELQKEEVNRLKEALKYMQADLDNLRKYYERERKKYIESANEDLIRDLLPILDSLEQSVLQTKDATTQAGFNLILKQVRSTLNKFGLKDIKAVGSKFDPYYHEVLMKEEAPGEEDVVVEEYQKGYLLNNRVLRYSKVKVSGGTKNG